jgi:HEAT repeats
MNDAPDSRHPRFDPDLPPGIRYDPDLAVHEPMRVPDAAEPPSRRISPLVLFPAGLLILGLGVYILFGLIASEGKTSSDYLGEIRLGRGGAWQAAFEMSRLIPLEDPRRREPRFVPDLLAALERSRGDEPRLRRFLVLSLSELRDARAVEPLLAALADEDLQTRIYAALGLGALGDARAAPALLSLSESDEADLRKSAAYALGALDAPGAVERLRELLNDPVEDVAWNAALALARRGDRTGLPLLGRMLDRAYLDGVRRPDPSGRALPLPETQKEEAMINAMRSMAALREPAYLPSLLKIRDSDPSLRVRQAAFETVQTLKAARP